MRGVPCRSWRVRTALLVSVLAPLCTSGLAGGHQRSDDWPRVTIGDSIAAEAVYHSLNGASKWLADARCRQVFGEFHDQRGRPLERALEDLGISGDRYLAFVVFRDGGDSDYCTRFSLLAFTSQSSRVVTVCGRQFAKEWRQRPHVAYATIIHEALHTLGLGENPPSSAAITQRVLAKCDR